MGVTPSEAPAPRPNIVLVNCDDLGYGDLGCYGSRVNRTPAIDSLAAQGVRLTDFYMASPVCSPSRGALLTGCYPPRIGFDRFEGQDVLFPGMGLGLNPQEHTIASLLRDAGYATMMVGKWHCGDQPGFLPTDHGFDHYFGLPYSNDMGRQVGHEDRPPLPLMLDDSVVQQQPDQSCLTERYTEHCVRFIREHRAEPFFLYLGHMYVHLPIYPPHRFLRESVNGRYGAAVECVDWSMATILHELGALGLADNTLVIFTSDNGSRANGEGGSNAPLRGTKGTTWEGGQRVPCVMRWPDGIPAGQVRDEIVTSMDLLPTLLRLAGAEPPDDRTIDGLDVSALLAGGHPDEALTGRAFCYYHREAVEAVRVGRWKLHVRKDELPCRLLFDLVSDPGELLDVASAHPEVVTRLEEVVESFRADLGDSSRGIEGSGRRPVGRVPDPRPLTSFDPTHPYIEALYDMHETG